jgi:hypothetical protein
MPATGRASSRYPAWAWSRRSWLVHLAAWGWPAIAAAICLGTVTFAALAVAISHRFMPDAVQPVTMFVYFLMGILGGLWFPLICTLQKIGQVLPTYQIIRIGTDVIGTGTVSITSILTILAWLAGFIVLAVRVPSTAETI